MKKSILYFSFLILIVSFLFSPYSFGEDKSIKFGSFPIPHLVLDENHGNFIELTRTIAERAHLDIEIVVTSTKRARFNFREKRIDVLFPAVDQFFSPENKPVRSVEPLFIKKNYAFTRKGGPLIKTVKDMEGKRVGISLGYPYAKKLTENHQIQLDMAKNDELNVLKLMGNRIDVFVVEELSGMEAFQSKGVTDKIQYDPLAPISEMDVYYAFQNTEKGKKLAEIVSKMLEEMKKDGTYSKILNQ